MTFPPLRPCSYLGLDSNLWHTYSFNVTLWMNGDIYPSSYVDGNSFEDSSIPYTILFDDPLQDLNLTFVDSSGLVEDDTWVILISSCGASNPLPVGSSATLSSQDGTATVSQLTLDRGFEGTVPGPHNVFSVNQHFTVRDTGTEVQSITVSNTGSSSTWTNGSPSYRLSFNGPSQTTCFKYDAEDWEMEVRNCKRENRKTRHLPCCNAPSRAHHHYANACRIGVLLMFYHIYMTMDLILQPSAVLVLHQRRTTN